MELQEFLEAYNILETGLKVLYTLGDKRYLDYELTLEELEDIVSRVARLAIYCVDHCDSLYDLVEYSEVCVEEPEYNEPGYIDRDPEDWGWDDGVYE